MLLGVRVFCLIVLFCPLWAWVHLEAATDLDPIIRRTPAHGVIRLEAGIYTTSGVNESGSADPGPQLKPGVQLMGKGEGQTIIILVPKENRSLSTIWGLGGNTVSDLTIDCAVTGTAPSYSPGKRNGLYLAVGKSPNKVSRVTVTRPYGNFSTRREGFGIIIHGPYSQVRDCLVSDPRGDYVQGFSFVGSPTVENCRVLFPTAPVTASMTCFGQGNGTNVVFRNCYSSGGSSGFYYDTGNIRDLLVENCTFSDAPIGIFFKNQFQPGMTQSVEQVTLRNNTIMLAPSQGLVVGISLDNTRLDGQEIAHSAGSISDVLIQNNNIGYKPSDSVPLSGPGLRKAISISSNCTNPIPRVCGIQNVTLSGNIYQSLPKGAAPWVHRNKWGAGRGIRAQNEDKVAWTTQ